MPIDERTILAELAEIRKAQREDHAQLVSQIGELSKDVSTMRAEGCGQAWQHKEHAEAIATLRGQVADLKESRAGPWTFRPRTRHETEEMLIRWMIADGSSVHEAELAFEGALLGGDAIWHAHKGPFPVGIFI